MNKQHLLAPAQYNIVDEFEKYALDGEKVALLVYEEEGTIKQITYQALLNKANQVANVFHSTGLQKGDIVLVMVPRSIEAYVTYIGALKAGLVIIPSSELLRTKDIEYRLAHAKVKAVVAHHQYVEQFTAIDGLESLVTFTTGDHVANWTNLLHAAETVSTTFNAVKTAADDMAFLAYTSGTTGNPKAAVHTHGWGYAHLRTTAKSWLGVEEGNLVWATAAPGWQKWIWSPFLATLGSGATAFVYCGKFEATKFLEIIAQQKIDVLCCTPTEYRLMAKVENLADYQFTALKSAVSAGEPLNREVIETFNHYFGVDVRDGYGQTENTLLVGTLLGMEMRPGSMGKPTPGNVVDIINEDGEVVAVGEVGNIAVHASTPALFKGYLYDTERTKMQYCGEWFLTGDRARKDEDGYFWFEGRSDDMIISSGYTIGPFEVEDALIKHETVKECAVVASPDEIRGTVVKAFVVLQESYEPTETLVEQLQQHVKSLTAPYKYPRKIEFLQELPKTVSGKIRRAHLRQTERQVSK